MDVRHSEVKDFLRCRKRWDWRWNQGLKPKKQNNKLFFGTLFHKYLSDYLYSVDDPCLSHVWEEIKQEIIEAQMDEFDKQEMEDMLWKVMDNYARNWDDSDWEVIATELTFKIPLDDEISYTGTIDLIVRGKNDGKIYFLDHKTSSSLDSYDKNSDMDTQISRYWWALQQLQQGKGEILVNDEWVHCKTLGYSDVYYALHENEIGGFIYNIILKDYPRPPKVLKDGSLSKAKNQNTTYELYVQELEKRNMLERVIEGWVAPDSYQEILRFLDQNPREYFRRVNVIRTQSEIDVSMEELYAAAKDMRPPELVLYKGYIPHPRVYRNITKDCVWDCPFVEICKASLDGSNVDFLIEELFTKEDGSEE